MPPQQQRARAQNMPPQQQRTRAQDMPPSQQQPAEAEDFPFLEAKFLFRKVCGYLQTVGIIDEKTSVNLRNKGFAAQLRTLPEFKKQVQQIKEREKRKNKQGSGRAVLVEIDWAEWYMRSFEEVLANGLPQAPSASQVTQ